jgi:hypothetical protein
MSECMTLHDTDRLCPTLYPESDSLVQSRAESDTTAIEPKVSETGTLTLREIRRTEQTDRSRVGGAW